MTRLALTLYAPALHKLAREAGFMWTVLNPGERKAERPWVARLTGFDDRYTFAREFVSGERAVVNSKRHTYTYTLTSGVYEVNAPTGYDQAERYWLIVEADGATRRLTRAEAWAVIAAQETPAAPSASDLARLLLEEDEHERS